MKRLLLVSIGVVLVLTAAGGCVSKTDFDKCVRRNDILLERIQGLESDQEAQRLRADKYKQQLDLYLKQQGLKGDKLAALQDALAKKQALIDQLTSQMGQTALPIELSNALAEWAQKTGSDLVTYDEKRGIVRFKSDLTFDSGSDVVKPDAEKQIAELSKILNSPSAQPFDILIVGHTDDVPIKYSAAKHPTNWHLSAHRAISVEQILTKSGVKPERLGVMGFGEFRPLVPNAPGHKGNEKNRRVEIYIVPTGQIHINTTLAN